MGKFGGKKPGSGGSKPVKLGGGGGGGKSEWPPAKPAPPAGDSDDDEEDDEEEEWSGEGSSGDLQDVDGDDDGAGFEESIKFMKQYLSDPLHAFMAAPDTTCDAKAADRVYAARAIVASDIDAHLAPTSAFAAEYRKMEVAHLKMLTAKLYKPRGAKAAEEVAAISAEDLAEDGTGLMWSTVFGSVCESLERQFPETPFEFSEQDEAIFNHCTNVTPSYVDNDPFKGITFTFDFAPNPYFENAQIRCSFHFVGANLAVDRVGVDFAAVCGVVCDTPLVWKKGHKFQSLPEDHIEEADKKAKASMLEAFFVSSTTTPEEAACVGKLMAMWPRPLFSALFDANTSASAMAKLRAALVSGKDGHQETDESANGLALVRAGTLELVPWRTLVTTLANVVRAPMITAMDLEHGGMEMAGGEGDDEEDEEGDEEESGDEAGAAKPAAGKKNRAEAAAPPKECKQQ